VDKQFINDEITAAMRAQDKPRLAILRLVKNEIEVKEKQTGERLTDSEVVATLKKVLKQTGETLEGSEKVGTNAERTALLAQQVDILTGYLPAQVSGPELSALVDRVVAEGGFTEKRDMGRAIGMVVSETGGNVDKAEVAKLVGAKLG
jgi:uncharacterized protein YqeY